MSFTNSTLRLVCGLLVLALIVWGYWWLTWIVILVFLFAFRSYYEIIFFGIMYDSLYGLALPQFFNFSLVFTVLGIILFFLAYILRNLLSAYEPTI